MLFYCLGTDKLVNISDNICEYSPHCDFHNKSCLVVMMKSGSLEKQIKEIKQLAD